MTASLSELLTRIRARQIRIWSQEGRLFCSGPKGALTPELQAEISAIKRELIAFLDEIAATEKSHEPPIEPRPRNQDLPLSFAQERLWVLDQLEPGRSAYHMSSIFRLSGRLNRAALERSFAEIVRRHEALRTTFVTVKERPVQVVAPAGSGGGGGVFQMTFTVLRQVDETRRQSEAVRLAREEIRRPFNLSEDLMLRAGLFQLAEEEHVLFVVLHHIASDGWSMGILYRELAELYDAYTRNQAAPLPELPVQYADFACWQREWLTGAVLEKQMNYWRSQLADLSPLELPTDRPRPAVQSHRGAREAAHVNQNVTCALRELSRAEGASLFMTLVAAFQLLLHRYTGQEDIVVGTPIAGRNRVETERLIGFFLNTLVLRTNMSGDCTFRELLRRVREVTLGAYAHQELPFEKLLEELRPERDLSRTPLFQVFFNMVNVGEIALKLPDLTVESLASEDVESKFDFTMYVREHEQEIRLNLVYNSDIFDQSRMSELLAQYCRLLSLVAHDPEQTISSFSILTPAARNRLPNPTEPLDASWPGAVHERLSLQAKHKPSHPAVIDLRASWSYLELNGRSNQLARSFMDHGIGRGDVVAVYGRRCASLVWAVFGILKAGAAFLILDPAYPAARLIQYLRLGGVRGFVTLEDSSEISDELQHFISQQMRYRITLPALSTLDAKDPLEAYSADDPEIRTRPDDLAYLSFTSGSTGEPKGVLGKHGSLSHFLPWQQEAFGLNETNRFSLLSGLAHDPLQRDIFTPIWVGATLYIPETDMIGTSRLAQWMAASEVTFAHLTPGFAELLATSAGDDCHLPSLRHVFFVGDKVTRRDVARLRRLAPEVTCIGSYGATETQRAVGIKLIPRSPGDGDLSQREVYPLGRGMKDAQLLILNRARQLAGIGELGEIYVRSPHLAIGYLDQDLTREKFQTNPFTGFSGDRLYKTGDFGRYLPDGEVEFAGRADRQIKIRGFRVELEEIEAALSQHPSVKQALVALKGDSEDQTQVVAYVVPAIGDPPSVAELRQFLKARVPHYMVPNAFAYLGALPLTPNGKLDFQALPAVEANHVTQESGASGEQSELEGKIARVWEDVLHTSGVRVDDNFFDLGGQSLLAVRVISRLREELQIDIPLRVFFENPTVRSLAAALDRDLENPSEVPEMAQILADLELLSDDEAEQIVSAK